MGKYILEQLKQFSSIKAIRGKGLILGLEFENPIKALREKLLYTHKIFTGNSNNANTLRLLPSLTIQQQEIDIFINALKEEIS
jgi:acetylornithine aminotransferase